MGGRGLELHSSPQACRDRDRPAPCHAPYRAPYRGPYCDHSCRARQELQTVPQLKWELQLEATLLLFLLVVAAVVMLLLLLMVSLH